MIKIIMVVTCFLPNGAELKQAWRVEKEVTMEHCLAVNRTFAKGSTHAVITVRCGGVKV